MPYLDTLHWLFIALALAALTALTVALFLVNLRRAGERPGRPAERLEGGQRISATQEQLLKT